MGVLQVVLLELLLLLLTCALRVLLPGVLLIGSITKHGIHTVTIMIFLRIMTCNATCSSVSVLQVVLLELLPVLLTFVLFVVLPDVLLIGLTSCMGVLQVALLELLLVLLTCVLFVALQESLATWCCQLYG